MIDPANLLRDNPGWIKFTRFHPGGDGFLPHCVVTMRASPDSYHPFKVTAATFENGAWTYSNGDYHFTIEDALASDRMKP